MRPLPAFARPCRELLVATLASSDKSGGVSNNPWYWAK